MTDIFISYSSKDRDWIKPFAGLLEEQGYRVWWDTGLLAGHDFQITIPAKLAEASCVIVIWTENSVGSVWVRAEANRALLRKILVPVWLRDSEIPMPFDIIHAEDFRNWKGDKQSVIFKRLLLAVAQHTEPSLLIERAEQQRLAEAQAEDKQRAEQQRLLEEEAYNARREREEEQRLKAREAAAERERLADHQRWAEEAKRLKRRQVEGEAEKIKRKQEAAALSRSEQAAQRQQVELLRNQREAVERRERVKEAILGLVSSNKKLAFVGLGLVVVVTGWQLLDESQIESVESPDVIRQPQTIFSKKQQRGLFEPLMVSIPGGGFTMGCVKGRDDRGSECNSDEKPAREVAVSDFQLAATEVTVAQYFACVNASKCPEPEWRQEGSNYNIKGDKNHLYKKMGDSLTRSDHPIVGISWDDANTFARWLREKTGKNYRLPTEAEWEYASRGGSNERVVPWGQQSGCGFANIADQAAQSKHSGLSAANCNDGYVYTAPVGRFIANEFGLYDMSGNVWEWVQDFYGAYSGESVQDPVGVSSGSERVIRGGSWKDSAGDLRSAKRYSYLQDSRGNDLGFRLAQDQSR